ncbi:MAG: hypothetical protein ACYC91_00120 [Solirubrobacteraceae bacterium]
MGIRASASGSARAEESAHDVLAAEAFVVPAPDPELHVEPVHDVLAAEEFAMPAPDPILHHHAPVVLPQDPGGTVEPHDVLAAEAFPMPAPRPAGAAHGNRRIDRASALPGAARAVGRGRWLAGGFALLLLARWALTRRG